MAEPLPTPSAEHGAEDRDLERTIGPQLVARLHGLVRAARLYSASNEAYQRQLRDLMASVESAMVEDETALVAMGEYFYVNGVRIKADASRVATFHLLFEEFDRRALGAIRFLRGLTTEELEAFLQLFLTARDAERAERLPEQTAESGLLHVVPVRMRDLRRDGQAEEEADAPGTASERQRARRTFWRAVVGTRSLVLRSARSGRPALRQARRVVQPIVDTLMKNEYSIIGLTALKNHDEYTYAHCVNVSVLSVSMGHALGLPRTALANLGVAALLHDIGKIAVPAEVLHKPGALTRAEWEQVRRHPLEGLKMVARMPGLSALTLDLMRVCFQHHMNMDRSGYPELPAGRAPAGMARIVAVADYFDAITAHREYRARPLRPHEALRHLVGPDREHFDPAVLWALIRSVGVYPTGTVMRTESDHVVLSVSPNRTDPRRPFCRVLVRPDGTSPAEGEPATWDPMSDEERVARVLEPDEFEGDAGELLAA